MGQAAVRRLGYVGIGVRDPAAWETFATQILGLVVSDRLDDGTLFFQEDNFHHRIAVHPTGDDDIAYVGWEVTSDQELAEVTARLDLLGVTVTRASAAEASQRGVIELIRVCDPDGIQHEIYYGLAKHR